MVVKYHLATAAAVMMSAIARAALQPMQRHRLFSCCCCRSQLSLCQELHVSIHAIIRILWAIPVCKACLPLSPNVGYLTHSSNPDYLLHFWVSSPHPPLYERPLRIFSKSLGLSPTLLLLPCYCRIQWIEVSSDEPAREEMEGVGAIERIVARACRQVEEFDTS
jgi:hypothetical protein